MIREARYEGAGIASQLLLLEACRRSIQNKKNDATTMTASLRPELLRVCSATLTIHEQTLVTLGSMGL